MITGRGVAFGALAGLLVGAAAGSVVGELIGLMAGAVVGSLVGGLCGLVNEVALAVVVRRSGGRTQARWVAMAASAGCAVLAELEHVRGHYPTTWLRLGFVVLCSALGLLLGPLTAFGVRPVRIGRAGRGLHDLATLLLARLMIAGSGVGAVTGLVIGLRTWPATAAAAAVEGAILGAAVSGVVFGVVAAVWFGPRLRARR